MKIIISHPTGNQNVRAAVAGLNEAGLLSEFHTTIATFQGGMLDKMSRLKPFAELQRRNFDSALSPFTNTWPWFEAGRLVSPKLGLGSLTKHEKGIFCIDSVFRNLDKRIAGRLKNAAKRDTGFIYAYEDGAAYSFRAAKALGIKCLYDLPIGYWRTARRLLEDERNRWPDWLPTLTGFNDSTEKLTRKDEELSLADKIFVASQFTASTLLDYPGALAPVQVITYGFPEVTGERTYQPFNGSRPLKLLFVGGLSQRKGLADLMAAVNHFGHHVELTIVGRKASAQPCAPLDEGLKRHTWIPSLSHSDILKIMKEHDVFVFPSLFEGFGLVITEAMSQGTPVITTNRTAGPDLIEHGQNGWLVDAGSTEALQNAIGQLISRPETIEENGRNAMMTAERRPWSVYGRELAAAIRQSS